MDGDRFTHNPEVAGSNPAPATSFRRSGPFPSEERAFCAPSAVVRNVVATWLRAAWQRDGETGRDGMRQPGRGGRCRPRSLGAWPGGPTGTHWSVPVSLLACRVMLATEGAANDEDNTRGLGQSPSDGLVRAGANRQPSLSGGFVGPSRSITGRDRGYAAHGLASGGAEFSAGDPDDLGTPVAGGRSGSWIRKGALRSSISPIPPTGAAASSTNAPGLPHEVTLFRAFIWGGERGAGWPGA